MDAIDFFIMENQFGIIDSVRNVKKSHFEREIAFGRRILKVKIKPSQKLLTFLKTRTPNPNLFLTFFKTLTRTFFEILQNPESKPFFLLFSEPKPFFQKVRKPVF